MKALIILSVIMMVILSGCQTQTVSQFETTKGDRIKVVIDSVVDKETEAKIVEYLKQDAEKHYASSNEPYKYRSIK